MTKILVIEDESMLLDEILMVLRFENYDAMGAPNGVIGLEMARAYLPDLILCDILMPELDGYGVLKELRRHSSTADIPFVFSTAKTSKTDLRTGMELGADDYLTKPFTQDELLSAIQAQLNKHEVRTKQAKQNLEDLREQILLALPHEMRTPLTVILGYGGFLSTWGNTMSPDEVVELGKDIYKSATQLHRLIENYLMYVQIETIGQDPIWIKRLRRGSTSEPQKAIKESALAAAQIRGREEDLKLEIEDTPVVHMDSDYLKKIVDELAGNAFKFSSEGTPVCLRAFNNAHTYTIEIQDSGRGMTMEQIGQIGLYMQFDRKRHEQAGSGMGLAIVSRLVDLHGGQFAIRSIPEQGTLVSFTIPLSEQEVSLA